MRHLLLRNITEINANKNKLSYSFVLDYILLLISLFLQLIHAFLNARRKEC